MCTCHQNIICAKCIPELPEPVTSAGLDQKKNALAGLGSRQTDLISGNILCGGWYGVKME
jgi:hypothetical protein